MSFVTQSCLHSHDLSVVAQFQPALGPTWQHNINVRIVIARDELGGRVAVVGECAVNVKLDRCLRQFQFLLQARAPGFRPHVCNSASWRMVYVEVDCMLINAEQCYKINIIQFEIYSFMELGSSPEFTLLVNFRVSWSRS
jgi:hypothetical protein